jgi:hypothetical protein
VEGHIRSHSVDGLGHPSEVEGLDNSLALVGNLALRMEGDMVEEGRGKCIRIRCREEVGNSMDLVVDMDMD